MIVNDHQVIVSFLVTLVAKHIRLPACCKMCTEHLTIELKQILPVLDGDKEAYTLYK